MTSQLEVYKFSLICIFSIRKWWPGLSFFLPFFLPVSWSFIFIFVLYLSLYDYSQFLHLLIIILFCTPERYFFRLITLPLFHSLSRALFLSLFLSLPPFLYISISFPLYLSLSLSLYLSLSNYFSLSLCVCISLSLNLSLCLSLFLNLPLSLSIYFSFSISTSDTYTTFSSAQHWYLGVFLTPLLAVWIMGAGKGISLVSTLSKLGGVVILPLIVGQICRRTPLRQLSEKYTSKTRTLSSLLL